MAPHVTTGASCRIGSRQRRYSSLASASPETSRDHRGTPVAGSAGGCDVKSELATDASSQSSLWIRPLGSSVAPHIDQTQGALLPFWSPDSQFVGFWAGGKLKKVRASGGAIETIYSVPEIAQGAWGPNGTILFAKAVNSPIFRVPPGGGLAAAVTSLLPGQVSQMWVQFLPDGKHFIYLARTSLTSDDPGAKIYAQSLDDENSIPC